MQHYITNFVLHSGPFKDDKIGSIFKIRFNTKDAAHTIEYKRDEKGISNIDLAAALRLAVDALME